MLVIKNSFVLILLSVSFIAMLTIPGCKKEDNYPGDYLAGTWKVVSFKDLETTAVITKTDENTWNQFNNGENTVSFMKNRVIAGKNVTNDFSGDFVVKENGAIEISNVFWTKINEPEWGKLFHSIEDAERYEISDGYLIIYYNQEKNCITLERN